MTGPSNKSKASKNKGFDYKLEPWLLTIPAPGGIENLHTALRSAGKSLPRYLFRTWNADSGGNGRLNKPDAITPMAFLQKAKPPASMFDIDKRELLGLIYGYLNQRHVRTPFSSWSHSLQFAISMMMYPGRDAHISVIDTRQLKPENFIFHCRSPKINKGMSVPQYDEEFLVYGVVEGAAHCAVPLDALKPFVQALLPNVDDFLHNLVQGSLVQLARSPTLSKYAKQIRVAKEFSRPFGLDFELPVAVAVLAPRGNIFKSYRLHEMLLEEFSTPTAWSMDPTVASIVMTAVTLRKSLLCARRWQRWLGGFRHAVVCRRKGRRARTTQWI